MSRYELDARRILCPLPVIRTQDKVASLQPGDELVVTCTDPGALNDIPAWCRINGHRVIDKHRQGDEVIITLEIGAG